MKPTWNISEFSIQVDPARRTNWNHMSFRNWKTNISKRTWKTSHWEGSSFDAKLKYISSSVHEGCSIQVAPSQQLCRKRYVLGILGQGFVITKLSSLDSGSELLKFFNVFYCCSSSTVTLLNMSGYCEIWHWSWIKISYLCSFPAFSGFSKFSLQTE